MTAQPSIDETQEPPNYYARFPRRLNALSIDLVVMILFSALVFWILPSMSQHPSVRSSLAVIWWGGILLYDPAMVAWQGGTIGHRLQNLRVVDNRTGGNLSFLKALGRFALKAPLGLISFGSMAFSKRHQAIHDILTRSTVQMRDSARALPYQYVLGPKPSSRE